jgi:hypothetical protein
VELIYRLVSDNPYDTFDQAEPWSGEVGGWSLTLQNNTLRATSESDDTAAIEPLLSAWAAAAYLRDLYEIRFVAEGSEIPPPPPYGRDRIFRRVNKAYPEPDQSFHLTSTAERLLSLSRAFTSSLATLPETFVEAATVLASAAEDAGGSIADVYNVDQEVVDKISELKDRDGSFRGPEWQWMQEALRLVTLQTGRRNDSPPRERLGMNDFRSHLAIGWVPDRG